MKAIWNGQIIAESDLVVRWKGSCYFPAASVRSEFLKPTNTHTLCLLSGQASYYTLEVAGQTNPDAAWHYPSPTWLARKIEGHVAFWKGVEVQA